MAVKTFDPKQVSVIVGVRPVSGFADGTFVTATRDEDAFSKKVGADGEVARTKSNNRTGSVVVTIMQTSKDNDFFSGLEAAGTVVPIFIRDASGRTLVAAEEAWVKKVADVEFGKESGDRAWTFDCGDIQSFVGGN